MIFVSTPHTNLAALPAAYTKMYSIELTDQYNAAAAEVLAKTRHVIGTVDTDVNSLVGMEFPRYFKDGHHFNTNSSFYISVVMQTLYVICSAG